KKVIDAEIGSIMENYTWILSDIPPGCKPLGCKWIFKRKMKVDGTIDKFKARLVIQSFRQKEGIDYCDTYAPVARITTIRLLLALAAIHNLVIHQMDIKTTFLNGDLDEKVYEATERICYVRKFDSSGKGVIICLYVDDILIFDTDQNQVDETKKFLSSRFFMKDIGEMDVIIGIKIKRKNKGIVITQSHYIKKILKKFNREDCSPVNILMDLVEKIKLNTRKPVDQLEYSRAIGSLMYAMTSTRPDIAYVVGRLSSWYQEPKFLIKMPPRRTRNINDVYERIMARMDERLDQFVDQFSNRMNDMMNLRRCGDRNGRRSEDEELGNPFFEGDCSSSNEWGDHGVAGDDYEGAPVFDDDYEGPPIFDDDQYEEESMPVYDTDIEDVIEEEEGFVGKRGFGEEEDNIEDVVVVTNVFCSSIIQTTSNVDFEEDINTKSHELMSFGKSIIIKVSRSSFKFLIRKKYQDWYLKAASMVDKFCFKTIKIQFVLSRFFPLHQKEITRVFKYLRGTKDYGLSYVGYPSVLEGYLDASWINHVEDSSSTSGWVFLLGGTLATAGKEAEWLRNLIYEIPIWPEPIAPISIRCDSTPMMARAYSQIYNGKSRHLGARSKGTTYVNMKFSRFKKLGLSFLYVHQ
ncbi:zinc finger, CCHC-type containing protein, partial [Tanacetum coccineum]